MQVLGIQITIFAAVIAAFGAAAGLALSGTLQNFASGVLILVLKPFRVGDNIITGDYEGTVTSIQIFYTIVTTFDNRTVILPNSKLSNEIITNVTKAGKRRMDIPLLFSYDVAIEQVKKTVHATIEASADILKEPKPRTGIIAFEPKGFKFMVNVWVNAHGFYDTMFVVNERILADLAAAGLKPGEQ
jgi:small conductance mechanosensitive channel